VSRVALRQATALSRRSILNLLRQPDAVFPSLFFPLFFAALSSAAFERSTRLPGFPPVDSFLDFLLAATVVQGVVFGSTTGGSNMAVDIQDGFFDRLVASPVPRWSILVGRLAGAALQGAVQAVFFVTVLTLFGATVKGGLLAVVVIVVVAGLLAVAMGGLSLTVALRTGSREAVEAAFPLFFITIFVSSAFFPRELMSGWFKAVATTNPLSWMIESLRRLTIDDFAVADALTALAVVVGFGAVTLSMAGAALRRRVAAR
jgi:ABC-2 type transport system permease protein